MIIGEKREQVIGNIRTAAENETFHTKVELDDPIMTPEQRRAVLNNYVNKRDTLRFSMNSRLARNIINLVVRKISHSTEIVGMENISGITGGAILTSNHFSPLDNIIVHILAKDMGKKKLFIVSQETNLVMQGFFGYLMNYADTLPISTEYRYMTKHFEPLLKDTLEMGNYVLIYPEQERWFNYRKPRPLKSGAYYYAAKFGVPVISCFVEITDLPEPDEKGFRKVAYTLHVLKPIFPDPQKSVKQNRTEMCQQDYLQKKAAYEAAYHKRPIVK